MATLTKHNLHHVKKLLPFPHTPTQAKQVERSFNRDGYKTLRVLAFGEDLCKTLKKRVGYPGMVICLSNLKRLDYSEQSGYSFRIEKDDHVLSLGKSEEYYVCKGAEKKATPGMVPAMFGMNKQQCDRFLNKNFET